jgi:hypothetical protein
MYYEKIENAKFKVIVWAIEEHKIKPEQILDLKPNAITKSGLKVGNMVLNMSDDIVKAFGKYVRDTADKIKMSGYLFPSRKPGEQWTKDNFMIALRGQLKRIGSTPADLGLKMPSVSKKVELQSLDDIIAYLNKSEEQTA